jgi:CDP-diacylglycerol---glycerol-3-phosphate 3-phosphatidyltransferase
MSDEPNGIDRFLDRTLLWMIPKQVTPNQVTWFRFIATPFVLFFLLIGWYGVGFITFLFVAFTDAIDGALARTRNMVTDWGRLYDPLADKFLISSVVFAVVVRELDPIIGITIVSIEAAILGMAAYGRMNGRAMQANKWGKLKMLLEVIGVCLLLLALTFGIPAFIPISTATFMFAILFALVSLVTYGI